MRTKIEEIIVKKMWAVGLRPNKEAEDIATDLANLTKQTAIDYHLWRGSQPPGQLPNNVDLYDYWIKEVKGE